jgi:hypothetical protein
MRFVRLLCIMEPKFKLQTFGKSVLFVSRSSFFYFEFLKSASNVWGKILIPER